MTEKMRPYLDLHLALSLEACLPGEQAYQPLLAWKGIVFSRQRLAHLGRNSDDPKVSAVLADLQSTASRLATLVFTIPDLQQGDAWQRQIAALSQRKEELEGQLSGLSAEFRRQKEQQQLTPEKVQAVLPADAALVDYLAFSKEVRPVKGQAKLSKERRLVAFVVRRERPIAACDLGPIQPIADAIERWRLAVSRVSAQPSVEAQQLRRALWEPLEQHLEDAKIVLISPDDALARFPFAALPGKEPDRYLIEERAVAPVPVPQMLPELLSAEPQPQPQAQPPRMLLVGNVDFDNRSQMPAENLLAQVEHRTRAGGLLHWGPLPGTAAEIQAIAEAFRSAHAARQPTVVEGSQATVDVICQKVPQAEYLHFATHGFFAPPEVRSALDQQNQPQGLQDQDFADDQRMSLREVVGFHPGLLSGLVLAGANQPGQHDDGVLTAAEVAELDLRRMHLAVLSACETGLGRTAGGEGLLGLQRAFQSAGARSVVASLWRVPDDATRALMVEFYQNLWQKKLGKLEALRQAQLTMLRQYDVKAGQLRGAGAVKPVDPKKLAAASPAEDQPPPSLPPCYWAAFVLSGDWR